MATALSMITRAMRLAKVIGKGETLDSDEATDGLDALNTMLESWATERLFIYAIRDESFTWTASAQSRTVGSGGNFSTDRPVRVDPSTYFTVNGVDYALKELLTSEAYSALPVKTTESTFPEYLYVDYTSSALVTLYAYPVPNASITIHLRTWRLMQAFSALTDVVALPPGYKRAIEYSLAEEFGPEFGANVQKKVEQIAARARANLKRINAPKLVMASEVAHMNTGGNSGGNVYADIT